MTILTIIATITLFGTLLVAMWDEDTWKWLAVAVIIGSCVAILRADSYNRGMEDGACLMAEIHDISMEGC